MPSTADETTQAPSMPVYVVRPVFDDRYELRNSYGSPLNGSEMRYAARAVNAFEPMRAALVYILSEHAARFGECDCGICTRASAALRAADGATEGT